MAAPPEEIPDELRALVFDEKAAIIKEIDRISEIVAVTKDGVVLLKRRFSHGITRLLAYMLGKVVAEVLGFVQDGTLNLGEISLITQLKGSELLNVLISNPYVVFAGRGKFRLNTVMLSEMLNELDKLEKLQ